MESRIAWGRSGPLRQNLARRRTFALVLLAALWTGVAAESKVETPAKAEAVRALIDDGHYLDAESLARRVLANVAREHGFESVQAAEAADLLVEALWRAGKGGEPEARELAERAVRIKSAILGEEDPAVARSLDLLGTTLEVAGDPDGAAECFRRALAILVKTDGEDHPRVGSLYESLALLSHLAGDFREAERLYETALRIRQRTIGSDHLDVALNLNLMGILYWETGDYVRARPCYERALKIRSTALRADHPLIAGVLINRAILDADLGDLRNARESFERALAILQKSLDAENPLVATSLINLADVLWREGDYDEAQRLARLALSAWEKKQGPYHEEVVAGFSLLGSIAYSRRDYETARSMFATAVEVSRGAFGERHPTVARERIALAEALLQLNEYGLARRQLDVGLDVLGEVLTSEHPDFGVGLNVLSRLYLNTEQTESALRSALRAEEVGRRHLRLTLRSLPERQSLLYATSRVSGLDLALTLAARGLDESGRRAVLDGLVRSRALVLDEMAERHRSLAGSGDVEIDQLAQQLLAARTRLANLIVRRRTDTDPERFATLLDHARSEKERLERQLAEVSLEFREASTRERVGLHEVERHLPADSALVSYVRYLQHRAHTEPVPSYLALVERSGSNDTAVIPIGSADEVESRIARWRREIGRPTGGGSVVASENRCREIGETLRGVIWDPIVALLRGVETVFVVPDGALHAVNLSALPVGEVRYLVESGPTIHYLSAERDLSRKSEGAQVGSGLLVMGDPDFDAVPNRSAVRASDAAPDLRRATTHDCNDLDSRRFGRLPGTGREARDIVGLWRRQRNAEVLRLLGKEASEAGFKREAAGREIVHVATHGFFLSNTCSGGRDMRGVGGLATDAKPRPKTEVIDNPLLRSGLVFAGVNRNEVAAPDEEDGFLTAEEIAGLDLSGVSWAVLSACDTGAGEVVDGEGVLGLRRAFQTAGVTTLVMSLWPVEDRAGRDWMRRLYEERLAGRSTSDAVRQASVGVIETRRRRGETTHPFYWGGFVAVGDWR